MAGASQQITVHHWGQNPYTVSVQQSVVSDARSALHLACCILQPPVLEEVEAGVVEKYRHIAPRFNFRRACASVLASDLRVGAVDWRTTFQLG